MPTAALIPAFNPGAQGFGLHTPAVEPDGGILVGGFVSELGGMAVTNIGRLHPDGRVDPHVKSRANSAANQLVVQPDGKILAGLFTELAGEPRNYIGRLSERIGN